MHSTLRENYKVRILNSAGNGCVVKANYKPDTFTFTFSCQLVSSKNL